MAKKQDSPKVSAGLFARTDAPKTQPAGPEVPHDETSIGNPERPAHRVRGVSVALQEAELTELQGIADSVRPGAVDRGNVMSYAVRLFLREYKAGRIRLKRGARNMLELPEGYELPAKNPNK